MKSIQFLVVGMLAMLCACQPSMQSNLYTVTGELDDSTHHGKKIYIMRFDDSKYIDSTFIDGKTFVFKGVVDTVSDCRIDVSRSAFACFILEGGDIKVNLKKYTRPSGTSLNEAMSRIMQEADSILLFRRQSIEKIREKHNNDEEAIKAEIQKFQVEYQTKLSKRTTEIYSEHSDDALGLFLMRTVFMNDIDLNVKSRIMNSFGPWLKSKRIVKGEMARLEALKKTAEGMPFTDIKGKDADGNPVALSDYIGKGNYVLLDMWASWCGPCKGEIPYLLKLHNQYKNKGLTVLGLFVWDKEENLKKAIEAEGIVWPQIVNVESLEVTDSYGVDGIPHIILFAPDGTILKRDLRGQNMIDTVDEVMKKK